jgi:hypothetical protein
MPTPTVSVCCTLRQDAAYVDAFVAQIGVQQQRRHRLTSINVVCDGQGVTSGSLQEFARRDSRVRLITEVTSDHAVTSVEEKAVQWAAIANQVVEAGLQSDATHLLYLEPDLCFPLDLIDQLTVRGKDIIAPIVWLGGAFYDSWGFRDLSGKNIQQVHGIHAEMSPIELGSVGSCVLFRREVFDRGIRFRGPFEQGLLVGVCQDARQLGFTVWADPAVAIVHPTSLWRAQTWTIRGVVLLGHDGSRKQFAVHEVVAGFYDYFVLQFLARSRDSLSRIGAATAYSLTVVRDPASRSLELVLQPQTLHTVTEFHIATPVQQVIGNLPYV